MSVKYGITSQLYIYCVDICLVETENPPYVDPLLTIHQLCKGGFHHEKYCLLWYIYVLCTKICNV